MGTAAPNTPSLTGYLVAYGLAALIFSLLMAATVAVEGEESFWIVVLIFLTAAGYGIPFAAVLIPIVHFACIDIEAQWVHVVAAGLAGVLAGVLAYLPVLPWGEDDRLGLLVVPLLLGASTAAARALVIPSVIRRRTADFRPHG